MTSTVRFGERIEALAELEEERRFLLRSLKDLDAEFEAGDVEADDYETLKDGYTVRAATVLRQIDAGKRDLAPKQPKRWGRIVAVLAASALGAAGIGFALAQAWGERGVGQEITGFDPGDDARAVLASARAALNDGNLPAANELFFRVVESEADRDMDNSEALTYYGWTLALGARGNPDQEAAAPQYEVALLFLERAINADPDYADPYCFAAIIESNFRDDPARALGFLDQCESSNPPAEVAKIIENFAEEIRTAAE